jgi:hypothetical protein
VTPQTTEALPILNVGDQTMPPVSRGDFVRYIGDIENLVGFIEIDDQDIARNVLNNSPILISDILDDSQVEIEIHLKDMIHFLYINEVDIQKLS